MAAGNLAASVHQKLLDKANDEQRPFSELQAKQRSDNQCERLFSLVQCIKFVHIQ